MPEVDFSDLGGKRVPPAIDFSDLGGKAVGASDFSDLGGKPIDVAKVGKYVAAARPWRTRAESDAEISRVSAPQAGRDLGMTAGPRLSIGPRPRSTAEGLVAEQAERQGYGTAPRQNLTPDPLFRPSPLAVPSGPSPTPAVSLSRGARPQVDVREPAAIPVPVGPRRAPTNVSPEEAWADIEGPFGIKTLSGYRGWGEMYGGLKKLGPLAERLNIDPYGEEPPAMTPAERKQTLTGASETLRGATTAATPLMAVGAIAQPELAVAALAGSYAGGYGARKLADAVHASPEAKDLIDQVGQLAGATAGGVGYAGLRRGIASFRAASDPEAALAELLWKRGRLTTKDGTEIPINSEQDAHAVAQEIIRQNPRGIFARYALTRELSKEASVTPGPSQAEMGQRAARAAQARYDAQQAAQEAEFERQTAVAKAEAAAQYDPSARLLAEHAIAEQNAAKIVNGIPITPPAPPSPAPPPEPAVTVTPQMVEEIGGQIARIQDPVAREQAMKQAHGWLAENYLKAGTFTDPHTGKLVQIRKPEDAEKAALDTVNTAVENHDKALIEQQKAQAEQQKAQAEQKPAGGRKTRRQQAEELAKPRTAAEIPEDESQSPAAREALRKVQAGEELSAEEKAIGQRQGKRDAAIQGLPPQEAAKLPERDYQRWLYPRSAERIQNPKTYEELAEAQIARGEDPQYVIRNLEGRAGLAEEDPQELIRVGVADSPEEAAQLAAKNKRSNNEMRAAMQRVRTLAEEFARPDQKFEVVDAEPPAVEQRTERPETKAEAALRTIREETAKQIAALSPDDLIARHNEVIETAIDRFRKLGLSDEEARQRGEAIARDLQPGLQDTVDRMEELKGRKIAELQQQPKELPPAERQPFQKGSSVTFSRNFQISKGEGKSEIIPKGTTATIDHPRPNTNMDFAKVKLADGRVLGVGYRYLEAGAAAKEEAPKPADAAAKEPWQMTQVEVSSKKAEKTFPIEGKVEVKNGKPVYTYSTTAKWGDGERTFEIQPRGALNGVESANRLHKKVVEAALAEGKPVPPEVLADYPDLKPVTKTEQAAPPKSEWQQAYEKALAIQPENADALRKMSGEQLRAIAEKSSAPAPAEARPAGAQPVVAPKGAQEPGKGVGKTETEKAIERLTEPGREPGTLTNREKFSIAYKRHLERAMDLNPENYSYGKDRIPQVVDRIVEGLSKGSANKDSAAIRATLKELGVKDTYKAIREYLSEPVKAEAKSWKPEIKVEGKWSQNGLAFPTKEEAESWAEDHHSHWMMSEGHRAVESDQKPNYRWKDGELQDIKPAEKLAPPAPEAPTKEKPAYEPQVGDLVEFQGKRYEVRGKEGAGIRLVDPENPRSFRLLQADMWGALKPVQPEPPAEAPGYEGTGLTQEDADFIETLGPKEEKTGPTALANAVYEKLKAGEALGNVTELNKLAEEAFGASRTSGKWTPKDAFDAMETGVNKYLLDIGKHTMELPPDAALERMRNLMDMLTSQGTRTEEQIKTQQFSTPPTESYVVSKVADLKPSDVVMEPSAGNGGLAVWAKAIGAKVAVNEIAPRRQAMLKYLGFDKDFPITAHDGELINALLDQNVQPTVIVMNPPFSAGAVKSYEAKNLTRYGFNHVDQALQRLAPGGRLVTILGGGREGFQSTEGANMRNGEARDWFDKIAKQYNVRANIRVSGKEYQKYGTNYATRIIVIDKDGPTPVIPKTGKLPDWRNSVVEKDVDTLEQAYNALREVAESRPDASPRTGSEITTRQPEPATGLGEHPGARLPGVRVPTGRVPETHGQVPATVQRPNEPGPRAAAPRPGGGGEQLPVSQQEGETLRGDQGEAAGRAGGSAAHGHRERQVAAGGLDLEQVEAQIHRETEEEKDSAFTNYSPTLKGGKHPGAIVETKAMATVPMPPITYKPNLPESVVGKAPDYKDAKLSAVQLEAVAIAGMQNEIVLPGGFRASALIGDGTGVGKGREGAAILWDNWRKGRKRLVWMTKSKDLIQDAIRDLEGLGATDLAKSIRSLGKTDASTPIQHEGVLFTTYALFRSGDKKGNTRAAQVDKWLRGDDNGEGGYLLMDESHNLKNAVVSQGEEASQIGQTVKTFLEHLPALRTVSLSATAATDVMNLGYLDRLGLWGPGTPFPNGFAQFAGEIAQGGMSAMEMIARELKAQGKYVSRTLTYRGVKYTEETHELSDAQKKIYDDACEAWQSIFDSMEHTIIHTTNGGGRQKARAMSAFFATQLRFFGVLLSSLKTPTTVRLAEKALADGKTVAITLVNTNEAAQNREKFRVMDEGSEEEPDYDFGPGRMLRDMVMEHYPTQQYKDDVDASGNPVKVPVVDEQGHPVQNPEAVKARDELVAKLDRELHMPNNPLDELIEQLGGPSKVAELTGRKQRFDPATNKLVNRAGEGVSQDKVNLSEMAAFQSGKKLVAVLSSAADTGISLHADAGAKNQRPRYVITHQVGWSADKAMQMSGRFNRSNQTSAPEYALLKSDLGGESRFISSIARRMESLEALSKGQTKTNAGTEGMSKVNFETDQGRAASVAFYNQLLRNVDIPGTEDAEGKLLTGRDVLKQLHVLKAQTGGGETVPPADRQNVTRLLNRLMALKTGVQQPVYDYFFDIFEAIVRDAIENNTIDTGVKKLKGDSFEVKESRELAADPSTGAKTFYYPVDAQERVKRMPAKEFDDIFEKSDRQGKHPTVVRKENGKLALLVDAKPIVKGDGSVIDAVHVIRPNNGIPTKTPLRDLYAWTPVDKKLRDKLEEAERDIERAKSNIEYHEKELERLQEQAKDDSSGYYKRWVDSTKQSLVDDKESLESAKKERTAAKKELAAQGWLDDIRAEWQKQYEAAETHKTTEHHLIGGAVMRYWNAIRDATGHHMDVYSTVDAKSGQRVVGIEIPASQVQKLLARISGGKSMVNADQIIPDVLKNGTQYDLEGGISIRRGRVSREPVVQFVTSNAGIQKNLKSLGVIHEIGIQPIYYLPTAKDVGSSILERVLKEYPVKQEAPKEVPAEPAHAGERGFATPAMLNPLEFLRNAGKVYDKIIDKVIDEKLDLGEKYQKVKGHDAAIAAMLHEKDHAPRYFQAKAESNVHQVTKGLSEEQVRLAAMMSDNEAREYLEEFHEDQYNQALNDPEVMAAVEKFAPYRDQLSQLRIRLGWHVRRDLHAIETEDGTWEVIDRDGQPAVDENGDPVPHFKTYKTANAYVEEFGHVLDHLKRTYPEHLREPLMGRTDEGPTLGVGQYGGIRAPRPDRKQRLATAEYFYNHGAKDFSGYVKSFTQAYHAALNQKIFDSLTEEATKWKDGTAAPPQITYRGKTYYSPEVARSMREAAPENRLKVIPEYRAYDPAKGDKTLIKSFEDGWATQTTGRPGISATDRYLAPKEVVQALDQYDMTRGAQEHDSIRRFFQEQIIGLFGPTIHVLNIMRRLAHTVGTGAWDPRVWPYYQKLFFSKELRERMAEGLADDAIDALSKYGSYTNTRDIGSLHAYFLGNLNPANWVRQTIGKFSKGILFDPKFLGGLGGLDQKSRVLAFDYLREEEGMGDEEASKRVEDGFGNYNRANWTERMKRWAKLLLFPGWDFSSLKWFLRHPIKTAIAPALATLAANVALNYAGKNKEQDKYDFGYLHYGDRKFRSSLFTEAMALHIATPILEAGRAYLEGGGPRDVASAAGQGAIRGGGGFAGVLRPDLQAALDLITNRQYLGGTKEIWKDQDKNLPGKLLATRQLDKMLAFAVVKTFPAVNRFLDASYDNVDLATGAGSILGVTNYKAGAEERLRANAARSKGYSQTLSEIQDTDPEAAERFVQDPAKAPYLMFNKDFSELEKDLKDIDNQAREVRMAEGISSAERKQALAGLEESRKQVLVSADAIADAITEAREELRKEARAKTKKQAEPEPEPALK